LFIDILSVIIYVVTEKITCESYITYKVILASNIFIYSLSNYIFIYAIRIFPSIFLLDNEEERFILSFLRKNKKYIESSTDTSFDYSDINANINDNLNEATIDNKCIYDDYNELKANNRDKEFSSNNNHKRYGSKCKPEDCIQNIKKPAEINILLKYHYRISKDSF